MKIGFIGLGKMGQQMVIRLLADGHEVVVSDHHQENIDVTVSHGAIPTSSVSELVSKLPEGSQVVWLMIQDKYVDAEIEELVGLLSSGATIVDGGNSDFRQSIRHQSELKQKGIGFVDVGTSGGILGLKNGFSIMAGGVKDDFEKIEPLIKSLAQTDGYGYFGSPGNGHYIKMVHNAIEYGMMESYAEGYQILREGPVAGIDLALVAKVWQHGSIIDSKLNELIAEVLEKDQLLESSEGFVAESGEARWTLEVAKAAGINTPAIQDALDVRVASQNGKVSYATKLLAMMRNAFGGHKINK